MPWRCLDRPDEVRGSIAEQCGGGLPDVEGLSSSTKYAGLSPSTGLEVLSVGPPPRRSSLNPRSNHRPGGPPSPLPSKFFSNLFQGKFQYNRSNHRPGGPPSTPPTSPPPRHAPPGRLRPPPRIISPYYSWKKTVSSFFVQISTSNRKYDGKKS